VCVAFLCVRHSCRGFIVLLMHTFILIMSDSVSQRSYHAVERVVMLLVVYEPYALCTRQYVGATSTAGQGRAPLTKCLYERMEDSVNKAEVV
jgi:hypothetical protein